MASSPRSPPPRLLSFARRGDERAGPQRALRGLAARSRARSFSLGSQRPLLSRQGVGGGASASSCLPLDLRWCGVWSCFGERRRRRLAMAHAHHDARACARTAVMKRTSGHGPQPCNCSCKEAKKRSKGGRRGNRIRPAKRCCVAWALWRAGSAAGDGEVRFLAVVLSTRRQVAGSPPREGRKDATNNPPTPQSPGRHFFCLASGGCELKQTRPWLGLVDLSRIPSGTFFREVHPGSEMASQTDQNKAK